MSQEPFGDIPLFRELQRLLAAGEGPVNLEIARQVALAIATQGAPDGQPDPAATASFDRAVFDCESLVAGYTRLPFDEPVRADVIGRAAWVTATLSGWRWLLEHLARRFSGELAGPGDQEAAGNPMQAALGQVVPLLMGLQAGTLVGHLAAESLGRHDQPIPRDDGGRLFFVLANVERVGDEYGFDPEGFRRWLALHEVSRDLVARSVPWLQRYAKSLLTEVVDAIEIDASDLERRFMDLQSEGIEALAQGIGPDNTLPIVSTERHRRALERLRAFLALFEGYATHAARQVAPQIVSDAPRIDEGMTRRRAAPSEGESLLSGVLGISVDRALESAGATFCAAVTELKGPAALNHVWDAPDNLPDGQEIRDPFSWIERHDL